MREIAKLILFRFILFVIGLAIGFFTLRIFFFPFVLQNDTMLPSFKRGEKIYFMRFFAPNVGDVVLFHNNDAKDELYVGRIVAVSGDVVEVKNGEIWVNEKPFRFSWEISKKDKRVLPMMFSLRDNFPIIKLQRNQYFILNDNLDIAMDSRFFGPILKDQIKGKFFFKFPFN